MSQVRDDIPLPASAYSVSKTSVGRPPKHGLYLLQSVGQSIPVEDHRVKVMRTAIWREHQKGESRFLIRRIELDGVKQWRCWRTA